MPPLNAPSGPQDPEKKVDISKILLPKKDAYPNIDSAQRINAGVLLAQEESATLPKPPAQPPIERLVPALPTEESGVKPLQTYKGDVENMAAGKNVSVVSVAAAEAERRSKTPLQPDNVQEQDSSARSWAMIAGGVVLSALAIGAMAFALLRPATVSTVPTLSAPFINIDDISRVSVLVGTSTRNTVMGDLQTARQNVRLPVGLVAWLYVQEGDTSNRLKVEEFLHLIAPNTPPELLRTLAPDYFLGVHSFEENQSFLLLQVDSYETAYRAMLTWEGTLRGDLLPLFGRNPSQKIENVLLPASTTPQFINTGFVDKIVENRDTRAYLNEARDILLLWTFLGRNTILLTTNEYTLREVLSRLNDTPIVPIPGQ